MERVLLFFFAIALVPLVSVSGCGSDPVGPGIDGGGPVGGDGGPRIDVGIDGNGGCVPAIEICGDRMDQNCDGRDTSCGDSDGDAVMACRAGDDLTRCDCDDARSDVRPPFGEVAGAPELCDGRDNDCNGRIDESAMCCEGCASLGTSRDRADVCTEDGTCDCSTEDGLGPCAEGMTCCGGGCTDVATDFENCGFCGAECTVQADRCVARECACGSGPVCDFTTECTAGSC